MKYYFRTKLKKKKSSLMWNFRLEVPLEICNKLYPANSKKAKRVLCILNDKEKIQVALIPDGNGNFYIIINKEIRKKLEINIEDGVLVEITKDESEYGIALPLEMEELLAQDEEGKAVFLNLTSGRQRSLLYLIAKPKSETIRLRKAITVLDYLKSVNGKLDFKELNIAFKIANNKFKK